jgi:hypothetical protein
MECGGKIEKKKSSQKVFAKKVHFLIICNLEHDLCSVKFPVQVMNVAMFFSIKAKFLNFIVNKIHFISRLSLTIKTRQQAFSSSVTNFDFFFREP